MPAVLGGGAYVVGLAVGWYPEALGLSALVAGLVLRVVSDRSIAYRRML
jgi:hypothetical protein